MGVEAAVGDSLASGNRGGSSGLPAPAAAATVIEALQAGQQRTGKCFLAGNNEVECEVDAVAV